MPENQRRSGRAGRAPGLLAIVVCVALVLLLEPGMRIPGGSGGGADATAALSLSEPVRRATVRWDIPIQRKPDVERWIEVFSGRQRRGFGVWLERMSLYEEAIRRHFRRRGIPEDLIFIAMIESGFVPRAVSPKLATGLWQFMDATARERGLRVTAYVDERLDPVRSTEAAAVHLESLYERFGSWYLAAAAYNAGEGRVARALGPRTVPSEGSDDLFWEIAHRLPEETRAYVPRLVAAAVVAKDPEHFGHTVRSDGGLAFEHVFLPGGISLSEVARVAGVTTEEIQVLNPHLIRNVTPPGLFYPVRVPAGTGERTLAAWIDRDGRSRVRLAAEE